MVVKGKGKRFVYTGTKIITGTKQSRPVKGDVLEVSRRADAAGMSYGQYVAKERMG